MKLPEIDKLLRELATLNSRNFAVANVLAKANHQAFDTGPIAELLFRLSVEQGETMNIIAAPKLGKSWLATDLALAVATGRPWLDLFRTHAGNTLILDYELHRETSADRIQKVAKARGIDLDEYAERIRVANLRGHLKDLLALKQWFDQFQPGELQLVIVDAFYRALPAGTNENDNGAIAAIYNAIDRYASKLGCSFVLIHHSSKGSQSGKSVTDVGAGAGSQSRATDNRYDGLYLAAAGALESTSAAAVSWSNWFGEIWTHAKPYGPCGSRLGQGFLSRT